MICLQAIKFSCTKKNRTASKSIFCGSVIMGDISIEEARARMIAKRFGGNSNGASTGGSGSMRRKTKSASKTSGGGEKNYNEMI